jgi:hypothetical protein
VRVRSEFCLKPRDKLKAMREATRDLIRLNRYERQAWSRLENAIHEFMIIKLKSSSTRAATQTNDQPR